MDRVSDLLLIVAGQGKGGDYIFDSAKTCIMVCGVNIPINTFLTGKQDRGGIQSRNGEVKDRIKRPFGRHVVYATNTGLEGTGY